MYQFSALLWSLLYISSDLYFKRRGILLYNICDFTSELHLYAVLLHLQIEKANVKKWNSFMGSNFFDNILTGVNLFHALSNLVCQISVCAVCVECTFKYDVHPCAFFQPARYVTDSNNGADFSPCMRVENNCISKWKKLHSFGSIRKS